MKFTLPLMLACVAAPATAGELFSTYDQVFENAKTFTLHAIVATDREEHFLPLSFDDFDTGPANYLHCEATKDFLTFAYGRFGWALKGDCFPDVNMEVQ
ncbi:hypothetical protein [Maritimibacter sp. DP1N21-5]|uniref:hypothetical protein n=1 Tax=Maritimibacter sp. DP1N21-5 TaxID=2836867 RepID=UPI001C461AEF|nr:hypothetical protein [Maritimibacter sp. DP1N21-5]MBV7408173.1 hypothetical protein [Maritimibacter sp. DP1N21-5]